MPELLSQGAARRRIHRLGVTLVAAAIVGALSVMVGIGGVLMTSFHRRGPAATLPWFALLGVAALAILSCIPLQRARARLTDRLGFDEGASPRPTGRGASPRPTGRGASSPSDGTPPS
ncbi:MAG: hypothetical protein AABZ30_10220 [Myxococcota bacterium]